MPISYGVAEVGPPMRFTDYRVVFVSDLLSMLALRKQFVHDCVVFKNINDLI